MEEPILIHCPWCGEPCDTFCDISAGHQSYTEDCQVCCRPIVMTIHIVDGRPHVAVERE